MALSEEALATLASQAQGKALVSLIQQAIEAPQVYSFAPLLALPALKAISGDDARWVAALRLFANGTYTDLQQWQPSDRTILSDAVVYKLKQLTLINIAARAPVTSYAELMAQLDIADSRDLERLLIASSYASLVRVSMNVKEQTVKLQSLRSRDGDDQSTARMVAMLEGWHKQCGAVITHLQTGVEHVYRDVAVRKQLETQHGQAIVEAERHATAAAGSMSPSDGMRGKRSNPRTLDQTSEDDDEMDVEGARREAGFHRKRKSATRWT